MEKKALIQLMTEKATVVGTIVQKTASISEAIKYAVNLIKEKNLKTIVSPGLKSEDIAMMSSLCKSADLTLLESPLRDQASAIDCSLTRAEYGIAETGTLLLASDSEEIRIATMLAKIHIAMLPISKIKPDTSAIKSFLDSILKSDSPSYTAFITGASRTADIERILAIGVHGPVEHHILLITEE